MKEALTLAFSLHAKKQSGEEDEFLTRSLDFDRIRVAHLALEVVVAHSGKVRWIGR